MGSEWKRLLARWRELEKGEGVDEEVEQQQESGGEKENEGGERVARFGFGFSIDGLLL